MSSEGSVSDWLVGVQTGDEAAAQKLWERYFQRMVALARKKLQGSPLRAADGEDVALSAFDSFCRGAEGGRFPRLTDRNDLWRLLVVITARKAVDLANHETRQKRGGGTVRGEEVLQIGERLGGLDQVVGREPTPEFAAQVAEEYQRLLGLLDDDVLRSVALAKMEGHTNEEIAARLGCVPRTVERKLRVIRSLWSQEVQP
jgi:DNA-directed RNA polymerase specialized sigma24 family protein